MKKENPIKRCKDCDRPLRHWNKSGLCSGCYSLPVWKGRYNDLKAEFERHKELCRITHLDLWNRLKKHEPDLTWDGEPE